MSKVCQITGIHYQNGNNVSHSNRKTKRRFLPNVAKKKFYIPEEDRFVTLKVTSAGLRLIDKIGLQAALRRAEAKGFLNK
ncbi:MAG: 50S ribosomal protein L28 [Bacteroidales bacterium]|nr:50S ribosomal protein L28 [Bacteroidales bacterium]MDD7726192.1 50S ribosomal protein L28 [Bacteroidales bacterium]MDY4175504.1 50S ribosomal protein L28 [Bacteroidales bacterium]